MSSLGSLLRPRHFPPPLLPSHLLSWSPIQVKLFSLGNQKCMTQALALEVPFSTHWVWVWIGLWGAGLLRSLGFLWSWGSLGRGFRRGVGTPLV